MLNHKHDDERCLWTPFYRSGEVEFGGAAETFTDNPFSFPSSDCSCVSCIVLLSFQLVLPSCLSVSKCCSFFFFFPLVLLLSPYLLLRLPAALCDFFAALVLSAEAVWSLCNLFITPKYSTSRTDLFSQSNSAERNLFYFMVHGTLIFYFPLDGFFLWLFSSVRCWMELVGR